MKTDAAVLPRQREVARTFEAIVATATPTAVRRSNTRENITPTR